jgi:2,4-diketo-3-deoxy-L-fuconate hydrolase
VRLVRIGDRGRERPAVQVGDDAFVDVADVVGDFDEAFFGAGGPALLATAVAERVAAGRTEPLAGRRLGAPNAAETGQPVPSEPIVFTKAPNSLVGPDDDVIVPRRSTKLDWEVELGVVIGRRCRYLADEAEAVASIAGYVLVNDVSERAFQLESGGQWTKGKSAETFNPCGPVLVTPDEIPDVRSLRMWLDVNGTRRQDGSTATMLFGPAFVVHYLSQFMVLEPGDLIDTGTPPGVGMGQRPPVFLQAGDVMELGIEGLGRQRQHVVPAP